MACSIGLTTVAISTLSALLLCKQSRGEAVRPNSFCAVSCTEKTALTSKVEDVDITLGNSLSCLLIQIDVTKKYSEKSPEIALNALEEAESIAQQSLGQLRLRRRISENARARSVSEFSKAAF